MDRTNKILIKSKYATQALAMYKVGSELIKFPKLYRIASKLAALVFLGLPYKIV